METREVLAAQIRAEMRLWGYRPTAASVDRLAAALAAQEIDFGEIGATAAVIGYLASRWPLAAFTKGPPAGDGS